MICFCSEVRLAFAHGCGGSGAPHCTPFVGSNPARGVN